MRMLPEVQGQLAQWQGDHVNQQTLSMSGYASFRVNRDNQWSLSFARAVDWQWQTAYLTIRVL